MRRRIVVIGGLAAGPSAASKAKRVNPGAEVILFEQGAYISYGICEVPYYIGGAISDSRSLIAYSPEELREKKGVIVKTRHKVEKILPTKRLVVVHDLERDEVVEHGYEKAIICTGSTSRRLNLPGESAPNVFVVKTYDDGLKIKQYLDTEHPKRAVLIGGGYIGMEMAEALTSSGIETTILHRSELPMAGLEWETRKAVADQLILHGVTFIPSVKTEGFSRNSQDRSGMGRIRRVLTNKGTFECDLIILSLGVEPNVELAASAGLSLGESGALRVDEMQRTRADNIYAAGDCCEVKNLVNNRPMYLPLATIASKAAWVAGENAAGGRAVLKGGIRAIAVKVFDLEVAQVGLSADEARESGFDVATELIHGHSRVPYMPGSKDVTVKFILDKKTKRLLGANLFGGDGVTLRANILAVAIQHKLTIDEISHLDLAYAPPFSPLWDPVLVAANVSKRMWSSPSRRRKPS
jgi:NADPH-dependent 2,4-dienoyl-CoA reductase/sulfur reductase-like enzyme